MEVNNKKRVFRLMKTIQMAKYVSLSMSSNDGVVNLIIQGVGNIYTHTAPILSTDRKGKNVLYHYQYVDRHC